MKKSIEKKIQELLDQIGKPALEKEKDGSYQGCLYPIQYLYKMKKYKKIDPKDKSKNYILGIEELKKYCTEIPIEKISKGDIVVGTIAEVLHFGIYLEHNKFIHMLKTLQVGRLKILKNIRAFKVK